MNEAYPTDTKLEHSPKLSDKLIDSVQRLRVANTAADNILAKLQGVQPAPSDVAAEADDLWSLVNELLRASEEIANTLGNIYEQL